MNGQQQNEASIDNNDGNESALKCQFLQFNRTQFCQDIMPFGGTISIIGDSLSWEQYSSLLQLLGVRVHQSDQFISQTEQRNHVQYACHTNNNTRTKIVWRNHPRINGNVVADSIEHDFPNILILNRGAHYVNDTNDIRNDIRSILQVVEEWQQTCQQYFTNISSACFLFWRTTVPGHPHCPTFHEPNNNLYEMEHYVETLSNYNNDTTNTTNDTLHYNWYNFQKQNQLILSEFNDKFKINYEIIDAYEIGIRRPDGHRWYQGDCLHNCYPGTMDVYNQILMHYLKSLRPPDDVKKLTDLYRRKQQQR